MLRGMRLQLNTGLAQSQAANKNLPTELTSGIMLCVRLTDEHETVRSSFQVFG
jgi:hypothetical protein